MKFGLSIPLLLILSDFAIAERETIFKGLDECIKTCSETCDGFVEAAENRVDDFVAKCIKGKSREAVRATPTPTISSTPPSPKPSGPFRCMYSYSQTSSDKPGRSRPEVIEAEATTIADAVKKGCAACGGNWSITSSVGKTSAVCQFAGCVDLSTGDTVSIKNPVNLVPAKCQAGHDNDTDLRGTGPVPPIVLPGGHIILPRIR